MYITLMYFLFPETRRWTFEEIGEVFGDKIASHWYSANAEEREKIAQEALGLMESGRLPDSDLDEIKPATGTHEGD
jgi:hypothetical protein